MATNAYLQAVSKVLLKVPQKPIREMLSILEHARAANRRIFVFGNGGSASTASHFAVDMLKSTVQSDRPRLKILCLNESMPIITAYSNDVSYDVVFSEPLASMAEPGDIAVALSASGQSPNVLCAVDKAREIGLTRIGLTGFAGGKLKEKCDVCVVVPSTCMQVIEDAHLVILHSIFLALCNSAR